MTKSLEIGTFLIASGSTLCTAESFTSGALASEITSVPGSSAYFLGSVVAYSEEIKKSVLNVDGSLIAKHGVVSLEVAEAMAHGARSVMGADYALATTGVAGPGGETFKNPVGTVCLSIVGPHVNESWSLQLDGSRDQVVEQSVSRVFKRFIAILAARTE